MITPSFVTFTGVDERTDIGRMLALSSMYPIEWGILFSPKQQGEGRYPPLSFLERLIESGADRGIVLSAHICGQYARDVVNQMRCPLPLRPFMGAFDRIQVNTTLAGIAPDWIVEFVNEFAPGATGILQTRTIFPQDPAIDWLFDQSGGNGLRPEAWPAANSPACCGYAGGIGPDNLADTLTALTPKIPPGKAFWIDMETGVRTDDRFDLDKCEQVCRIVQARRLERVA